MEPDRASGPSNHWRISWISANGDSWPAWPPAPDATAIRPSAPFSMALRAKRSLMMSCITVPPQPCTAWLSSSRAPREVITIGTLYFSHSSRSFSRRSLVLCTIWFTANGADGWSGCSRSQAASSSVMRASHSSSCDSGRAFSDGNEPTTPALHWAMVKSGLEMMNSGEQITGSRRRLAISGGRDMAIPVKWVTFTL